MLSDWTKTAFKSWIKFEREKCSDCLQVMHYAAFWEVTCKFELHSAWKRHIWEMIKGQGCWTPFVTNSYSRISQILDCNNCNHFDSQLIFFFICISWYITALVRKAKRPLCLMFLIHFYRLVYLTLPIFRMMKLYHWSYLATITFYEMTSLKWNLTTEYNHLSWQNCRVFGFILE